MDTDISIGGGTQGSTREQHGLLNMRSLDPGPYPATREVLLPKQP